MQLSLKKKQNRAQKTISEEFSTKALESIIKGAATKRAAPGTGKPLKNPGILFWSKIKKTNLVIPKST